MTTENKQTYSHFAKPADVWKHIVLCEVMKNEQPEVYVETNSAYASYHLTKTLEQEYGIYYFLKEADKYDDLSKSAYFRLEKSIIKKDTYFGSPGLAMHILGNIAGKFHFFDIETTALSDVVEFANHNNLTHKIEIFNQDSILGIFDLLPRLPKSTLIHIDPYNINKISSNGKDYLDVFVKASEQGMKCVLWYGFNTLEEKEQLNNFLMNKLSNKKIDNLLCIELIMDIIQRKCVVCNPGILGNGILTSNMSEDSMSVIVNYSKSLTELYKNSYYNGYRGSIHRDILELICCKEK